MYTHFPSFYGVSLSTGWVPLICGYANLGIASVLSSPPSRLLLQLNIGLCQRHNTLSSEVGLELNVGRDLVLDTLTCQKNLGGQLVVTWTPCDQCQVLTLCCPWGTISNLTAWCPTLPQLSTRFKMPHKDHIEYLMKMWHENVFLLT